ncbi:cation transport ATPase [Weissella kandleri]|uniref:Cd(2+)-exporting ATPase n=1 Tax=Weissella kandleri TaxID=1616 RepID=A0A0R2JLT5_9LACO|nr:cation-translocating P-type ATPase [Weissella kandleri]KRN75772.1 cation transport ATPase [Weissella kandleri]
MQKWLNETKVTILLGMGLILAAIFKIVDWEIVNLWVLAVLSVVGLLPIAWRAGQALRYHVISIELLVTIAMLGAMYLGEFEESAIVSFLFLFGSVLEQRAVKKTRAAVQSLTNLAPKTALVKSKVNQWKMVPIEQVQKGAILLIKNGAQIPVDGVVMQGQGSANQANLTGESMPVALTLGMPVFAGSYLVEGNLEVKAQKVGAETAFGQIIEMIEEAQDQKSPIEKTIDHFARWYTPAVLGLALLVGVLNHNLVQAITILILGCPGALVIGAPIAMVTGIGNGAKHGIMVKGGDVLATLAQVDTVVFDKTGTLTVGQPKVQNKLDENLTQTQAEVLATIEQRSNHPLAQALLRVLPQPMSTLVGQLTVKNGLGMVFEGNNQKWYVGNEHLIQISAVPVTTKQRKFIQAIEDAGQSLVLFANQERVLAIYGIADQIRVETKMALRALRQIGVQKMVMMTGDHAQAAEAVANPLTLSYESNLLPADKADLIQTYQKAGHKVAFVGDGVNDGPALAQADVGIAMGNGAEVAIETGDVILMHSNLERLVHARQLAQQTQKIVWQNITLALLTVAFLLLGLIFNFIYMASGMFVHEMSIIIVILNALRLTHFRP